MKQRLSRRQFGKLLMAIPATLPFIKFASARDKTEAPLHMNYEAYTGAGYGILPVHILYVSEYVKGTSTWRKIGLQSNASKPIKSLDLGFNVCPPGRSDLILHSYSQTGLTLPNGLEPGAIHELDGTDNLTEILASLRREGKLDSGCQIEVLVSKVHFDDGSVLNADS